MDAEQDQTREKVMLLLQRERELFAMRVKHEQVTQWLKIAQCLTALFDAAFSVPEIYARLRKALLTGLRVQRVMFLEIGSEALLPIAPPGKDQALNAAAEAFLRATPSGFCNDPLEPGISDLAKAVGLHRFFWSTIRVATAPPVLLLAGFDAVKSAAQAPLDENAAAQIDNTAQHIASLFANHLLVHQLQLANENLERRVSERTAELAHRNRDLHLVLDNVNQAFFTVDTEGRLAREHSAMVERWFGTYPDNTRFSDYIAAHNPAFAEHFQLSYEALLEDFLPLEVCLEQLPSQFRSRDCVYSCSYFPLREGEQVSGLVIVMSDVTEETRRKKSEAEHAELLALFQCFTRDRPSYLTFVREADQIVERLVHEALDDATRKRLLHTLKGNAAGVLGSGSIVELCHSAEDQLSGDREGSASETIAALAQRWRSVRGAMGAANGQSEEQTLEVPLAELDHLCEDIRLGQTSAALSRVRQWQTEPAVQPLARLAKHARDLARRLNKGSLDVRLSAPEIRLDPNSGAGLWASLVHVVRNAIDHGVEAPEERLRARKPAQPRLDLRLIENGDTLVIEIEDDGSGIDWAQVRRLAKERGLPHETEHDLTQALFASGLSTKSEVTTISGRGVGMSAVQEQIQELHGSTRVWSERSRGTRWSFSVPRTALAPAAVSTRPTAEPRARSLA